VKLIVPLARWLPVSTVSKDFRQTGVGMLELLIALLILSLGMMGLLAAQLAGKRASYEASQRSVATALARDIIERMRANPAQLESYRATNIGDEAHRALSPHTDCNASACSAAQLAVFDLWQWESLLRGESEVVSGGYVGGLFAPRACIAADNGAVAISINWLSASAGESVAGNPPADCYDGSAESTTAATGGRQRNQLTLRTSIGAR